MVESSKLHKNQYSENIDASAFDDDDFSSSSDGLNPIARALQGNYGFLQEEVTNTVKHQQ